MEIEFNRKSKNRQVGVRLTETEYSFVKKLADKNKASIMETTGVLIRAAIKELGKKA